MKPGSISPIAARRKGLSAPPGLSPFTVSPRAVERLNARTTPNSIWYLDLKLLMDYYDGKKYHHTAPVSTFYALREALAAIQEEGVEQRFARHLTGACARSCGGSKRMGLKMHVAGRAAADHAQHASGSRGCRRRPGAQAIAR